MNIRDLPIVQEIGHTPLLDATWTLLRDGWDLAEHTPWAEWECIAPSCHVLVRTVHIGGDDSVPQVTVWQQTVIWHDRATPSTPPREPNLALVAYVKDLFIGTAREGLLLLPPRSEVSEVSEERVSLFTCLGFLEKRGNVRSLPRALSFLPALP